MVSKGKRIAPTPLIVSASTTRALNRIRLTEKDFKENWMQRLLFDSPQLQPIGEIDPVFSPPIPLGREIQTKAGPIDNLYISPSGFITIVETKLYRNPQARREVIGQVIDYASPPKTTFV